MKHRLLFVCLGNICRSPMAQGVFAHVAEEAGLAGRFHLDSAGTGGWHVGNPPDPRACRAALARGIDISGQRARQVSAQDFERFDLLLAMDRANAKALARMAPAGAGERVRLFLEGLPDSGVTEVPDPYYGGDAGFDAALDLIEAGSRALLAQLTGGGHPARR
ncbi:MAG: low molecular weight protein-tyrosine-phosphatase [Methyloligellaceae bacterium]